MRPFSSRVIVPGHNGEPVPGPAADLDRLYGETARVFRERRNEPCHICGGPATHYCDGNGNRECDGHGWVEGAKPSNPGWRIEQESELAANVAEGERIRREGQ